MPVALAFCGMYWHGNSLVVPCQNTGVMGLDGKTLGESERRRTGCRGLLIVKALIQCSTLVGVVWAGLDLNILYLNDVCVMSASSSVDLQHTTIARVYGGRVDCGRAKLLGIDQLDIRNYAVTKEPCQHPNLTPDKTPTVLFIPPSTFVIPRSLSHTYLLLISISNDHRRSVDAADYLICFLL